jgi:hypothetical protein
MAKLKSILDFDSGGQSFFQRDSSSPPPWRLSPGSVFISAAATRAVFVRVTVVFSTGIPCPTSLATVTRIFYIAPTVPI